MADGIMKRLGTWKYDGAAIAELCLIPRIESWHGGDAAFIVTYVIACWTKYLHVMEPTELSN